MAEKKERIFKIKEQVRNIYYASKSFVILKASKKYKLMNKQLKERIMLSITEVNGCSLCSYVHTRAALSSGMTRENIKMILDGNHDKIPVEDAVAVMFSQDFAYSKENPSDESINRLIEEYGIKKAELVIAASNVITMTNGMGIGMGLFFNRLRFKRDKRSNIFSEIFNPLLTMVLFPILVLLNLIKCMFNDLKLLSNKNVLIKE
jgi:AhpD family alkylhydroperoxidase